MLLRYLKNGLRRLKRRRAAPLPAAIGEAKVELLGPVTPEWSSDPSVPADWRQQWIDRGYVIARGVFPQDQLTAHLDIVADVRRTLEETKDAYGYGERIGQLHQRTHELMALASHESVRRFLTWAFADTPLLFGSLNFDRGSQQDSHIDAIFFYTEPIYAMAGLWVALEDVHPDAGPLFYLPGSHRWPFTRGEHLWHSGLHSRAEIEQARRLPVGDPRRVALAGHLGQEWTRRIADLERSRGARREEAVLHAGDVVIWHALLAHGGSPRKDPTRSRRSVVYHFIGEHARLYTFDQFFLETRDELLAQPGQAVRRENWNGLPFMHYGYFASYKDGKEIIHRL